MPPKDFINTDRTKVCIRDANGKFVETDISFKVSPTLEPIEGVVVKTYNLEPTKFVARFSAKFRNKTRLLQVLGFLRPPRLTYRTNMDYINKRRYNGHKRQKKH